MNVDYQVNNQKLMTALDDFFKVGIGGRREWMGKHNNAEDLCIKQRNIFFFQG